MNENLKATGIVHLQHFDSTGALLAEQTVHNLVVTTGLNHIAARLSDTTPPNQMSHMALGTGLGDGTATAPSASDTSLEAQAGTRQSLTTAGGSISGAEITYSATFGTTNAVGRLVEAGVFNASSSGTMLCRTTFGEINKAVGDTLSITWKITVSAAA